MQRKINIIRNILAIFFIAVFVTGCTKSEKKKDYSQEKSQDAQSAEMIAKSVESTINDEVMFLLISQTTYKMFEIKASESGGITFTYQDTDKEYLKPFTEEVGKESGIPFRSFRIPQKTGSRTYGVSS